MLFFFFWISSALYMSSVFELTVFHSVIVPLFFKNTSRMCLQSFPCDTL